MPFKALFTSILRSKGHCEGENRSAGFETPPSKAVLGSLQMYSLLTGLDKRKFHLNLFSNKPFFKTQWLVLLPFLTPQHFFNYGFLHRVPGVSRQTGFLRKQEQM